MRTTSELWQEYIANNAWSFIASLKIGDTEYTSISAPKISRNCMPSALSVGNCISATLEVSILTDDDIDATDGISVLGCLTEDGTTYTEQLEFGTFYVDTRKKDYSTGLMTFSCYDSMLKLNATYIDADTSIEDDWPKTQAEVVEEIATAIGCGIDSRTVINTGDDYVVNYETGVTMMTVLQNIAACHGGNWIVTEENNLRLVPIGTDFDSVDVPAVCGSLTYDDTVTITGVTDGTYTSGDDTGYVIDITNSYSTENIVAAVYADLVNTSYVPYTATSAIYDPASELGDTVIIGDTVTGKLYSAAMTLNIAFRADLSTPADESLASEYPYLDSYSKAIAALETQVSALEDVVESIETNENEHFIFSSATEDEGGGAYVTTEMVASGSVPESDYLRLTDSELDIVKDGEVVSSFSGSEIHLGKNSTSSNIYLCGDTGEIGQWSGGQIAIRAASGVALTTPDIYADGEYASTDYCVALTYASDYEDEEVTSISDTKITLNAETLELNGGTTACAFPVSGTWFQGIPSIGSDGVMEIGRYIDFHPTSASTLDYGVRLDGGTSTTQRTFTFPSSSGSFVTHTASTAVGGTKNPVYIASTGKATSAFKVDYGTVTMTTTASGTSSTTITFSTSFSSTPVAFAEVHTSAPGTRVASCTSVSTTGMTIYLYNSNSSTVSVNVHWLAIASS